MAEYRSCRTSNAEQKTFPAIVAVSLFAIVVVLSCGCLNILLTQKYWHPPLGAIDSKLEGFSKLGKNFNTIIVGPSHLDFGMNPEVFDKVLGDLGHDVRSFNLSVEALSIPEREFVIKEAFDTAPTQIKFAVIECELRATPTFENLLHDRTRYFSSNKYVRSRFDSKFYSNRTVVQRYVPSALIVLSFAASNLNLGVGTDLFFPKVNSLNDDDTLDIHHTEFGWQLNEQRRSLRNLSVINNELRRVSASNSSVIPRQINEQEGARILADIDFIIQRDCTPIVIFPPVTSGVLEDYAIYDFVASNRPNVILLDFTPRSIDWNLFLEPEFWLDSNHLDEAGANAFSKAAAERLATQISKKKIEATNQ